MGEPARCPACGLLVDPADIGPDGTCCLQGPGLDHYDDCWDDGAPFPPEEAVTAAPRAVRHSAILAIRAYEALSRRVRRVADALADLELRRPAAKMAAVQRMLSEPHPATGKPMSLTSAEEYVLLDAEYQRYCREMRECQSQKMDLEARAHAAELRARLYTASLGAAAMTLLVGAHGPDDGSPTPSPQAAGRSSPGPTEVS